MKRRKGKKTKKKKRQKRKRQRQKRELILWRQGSFALLRCFLFSITTGLVCIFRYLRGIGLPQAWSQTIYPGGSIYHDDDEVVMILCEDVYVLENSKTILLGGKHLLWWWCCQCWWWLLMKVSWLYVWNCMYWRRKKHVTLMINKINMTQHLVRSQIMRKSCANKWRDW